MLTKDGRMTPEQLEDARKRVREYLELHGISNVALCKQVGDWKPSTVSEVLKGTYKAPSDDILRELINWVEIDSRRRGSRPDTKHFETRIARRIFVAAQHASRYGRIVLCHGPTGIGKSLIGHVVSEQYPGSIFLRLSVGNTGFVALRKMIFSRVRNKKRGQSDTSIGSLTQDELVFDRLRDSHRLLIIDEAHRLSPRALEYIRDIHDECKVPILLLCTIDLLNRIRREADEDHGQMYSRVAYVVDLVRGGSGKGDVRPFSLSEVRKIYESDKVRLAPDALDSLHRTSNYLGHGSLRLCSEIMEIAVPYERSRLNLDAEAAVTITAETIERVQRELVPDRTMQEDINVRRRAATA